MQHPDAEKWMAYLYEELPASQARDLRVHLQSCPECRNQVEQWRSAQSLLDADPASLSVARPRARVNWLVPPWTRWAVAAVLAACVGFLAGRRSGPDPAALQARLDDLEQRLQAQFTQALQATAAVVVSETRGDLQDFGRQVMTARLADQQEWLETLQRLEGQRLLEFATLREGLIQLARETGTGFEQTGTRLNLLATALPVAGSSTAPLSSPQDPQ